MAKRRKIKKKIKIFFLLLLVVAAGAIYLSTTNKFESKENKTTKEKAINKINTIKDKITKDDEQYPKEITIKLAATGDSMLHNSVYMDAYNKETDTFDFKPQISLIKEYLKDYDLAYYNQESVFGGRQLANFSNASYPSVNGYGSYPYFNSPSEFGDAMIDAGFNLVSLASNHSCDCTSLTSSCIENAYNYWKEKDVVFDGFNTDKSVENNYIIKDVKGITYSMLNYTVDLNGLDAYNKDGYIELYDKDKVAKDIKELRSKVDLLIVAMHWHNGPEYAFTPAEKNIEIANYLSDLGVDVILGTYSHCLQPFDIINDKTVVFYSLGNFISNQGILIDSIGYKGIIGALATMDITKTINKDKTSSIKVSNIGADLLYTYSNKKTSTPTNFKVIPFSQITSNDEPKYQEIFDDYSSVLTKFNSNINIIKPN